MNRTSVVGLLMLVAVVAPADATDTVDECMRANVPNAVRVSAFEMTTITADGARESLGGTLYVHRDDARRALTLQIETPSDLKGSAFLYIERDQGEQMFVFLSALNRVRQISGAAMEGQFFGSALRYSDVRQALGLLGSAERKVLADRTYEGGPVRAMELRSAPDPAVAAGPLTTSTLLVDAQHCVPLQLIVRAGDKVLRELSGRREDLAQDETRWYLRKATMRDHERKLTTHVSFGALRGFDEIPLIVFSRNEFHRARFTKR